MSRGRANLRNHGAADGRCWWRFSGHALLGCAGCVAAERNGPDVRAHERIPFGALAETDLPPTKRCPRVIAKPENIYSLLDLPILAPSYLTVPNEQHARKSG